MIISFYEGSRCQYDNQAYDARSICIVIIFYYYHLTLFIMESPFPLPQYRVFHPGALENIKAVETNNSC